MCKYKYVGVAAVASVIVCIVCADPPEVDISQSTAQEIRHRLRRIADSKTDKELSERYCKLLLEHRVEYAIQHGNVIVVNGASLSFVEGGNAVQLRNADGSYVQAVPRQFAAMVSDAGNWQWIDKGVVDGANTVVVGNAKYAFVCRLHSGLISGFAAE